MNKSDIVMLPISQLHSHPENPRKDVGDVSELSESIKVNGILQNLTVVPGHYMSKEEYLAMAKSEGVPKVSAEYAYDYKDWYSDDGYTVIIGHRRMAAAKKAGLTELPCIIANMSAEEQVATMLTENMQRENLTVYEQAKAFQQLSIDFGKSVSEIAEMSGFSETTVRRRTKLAELNEVAFKRACDRGANLFDFAELDKLETLEDKAKVLADMGTANFKNTLKETIAAQKYRHKMEEWIAALRTFATEIEKQSYVGDTFVQMNYFRNYGSWTPKSEEITRPDDADRVRYFFTITDTQISVYKEAVVDPEQEAKFAEKRKREDEERNRWAQIQDISARHRELRREFIVNFGKANRHLNTILQFSADAMLWESRRQYYADLNQKSAADILGISYDNENKCIDAEAFEKLKADSPLLVVMVLSYWYADQGCSYLSHDWDSIKQCWAINWKQSQKLDRIYAFLESLGYETSDEEREIANGTHHLYTKETIE